MAKRNSTTQDPTTTTQDATQAAPTTPAEPQAASAPAAAAPAPVAVVLAADTIARMRADGAATYEGEDSLQAFADLMRPVMATATERGDYPTYLALARQWRIGYEACRPNNRGVADAALESLTLTGRSQDAFEERLRAAKSERLLGARRLIGEKPKAASAEAERSRERRALPTGTAQDWLKKAEVAAKKGDFKAANEAQSAAKKIVAAAEKAARDAASERLGKLKEQAREVLKAILASDDEKRIRASIAALTKFAPKVAAK